MLANNFKALVVVLPLIFGVFFVARKLYAEHIPLAQIDRWRNLFMAVTVIVLLIANYWLMLLVLFVLILGFGFTEKQKPVLFLLLFLAIPPVTQFIPGFAGIGKLIGFSPQGFLALIVLTPCLVYGARMRQLNKSATATDIFFFLYALLVIALSFRGTSMTDGFRLITLFYMQAIPVYFVLSRWPKTLGEFNMVTAATVLPILALSATAIPEFILQWHFYAHSYSSWFGFSTEVYSSRGGFLRTYGSTSGPIAFGYLITVGLILSLPILSSKKTSLYGWGVIGLMAAALITTLSRGPWFGAILGAGLYVLNGPQGISRSLKLGIGGLLVMVMLLPTPLGNTIIGLLPFVGGDAGETIDYRRELLTVGWQVMLDNPLFGSADFKEAEAMQELIQGQGIIDVVNSYLKIGLESGFIGLGLYLGLHLSAIGALWSSMRKTRVLLPEVSELCRAYFSAYIAIMFILATTSSVPPVGMFNFAMAGLAVGLHRVAQEALAKVKVNAPAQQTADGSFEEPIAPLSKKSEALKPWQKGAMAGSGNVPKHLQQYLKD